MNSFNGKQLQLSVFANIPYVDDAAKMTRMLGFPGDIFVN